MAKLVYGGYGHHPSGKQYVYWGSDTLRTGQQVSVPVTNWKSGKNYDTMFTIQRTSAGEMGEREAERVEGLGADVKFVNGTDVMDLPGAKDFESKAEWKRYSQEEYEAEIESRVMGYNPKIDTTAAEQRLLGE